MKRYFQTSLLLLFTVLLIVGLLFDFKFPFYRHSPERFEHPIQQFEQSSPASLGGVLFYGSSSIRGWLPSLQQELPELNIVVRGFGGSMMHDLVFYFDRVVLPHKPKILVIYAGENDVSAHVHPQMIVDTLTDLMHKIDSALPNTTVYFISIKPTPHRWLLRDDQITVNHSISQLAEQIEQLHYIEMESLMLDKNKQPDPAVFQADGIHLSPLGYQRWTSTIKPFLNSQRQ